MDSPNFNIINKSLYLMSGSKIRQIMLGNNKMLQDLEKKRKEHYKERSEKIRYLEQLLEDKTQRIEELEQQEYELQKQLQGTQQTLIGPKCNKITKEKEQEDYQKKLEQKLLTIWCSKNKKWRMFNTWNVFQNEEVLNLFRYDLLEIPKKLFNLDKLQILRLSSNRLNLLPESLGNLRQLLLLDVADNPLSHLPQSLGNLAQLERLEIQETGLKQIPQTLGNLKKLEILILFNNLKLKTFPRSFQKLSELKILLFDFHLVPQSPIFQESPFSKLSKLSLIHIFNLRLFNNADGRINQIKVQCEKRNLECQFETVFYGGKIFFN